MDKDNYYSILSLKQKYKFDTESKQGRFQCRLFRLILVNEYYKITYPYYALNYPSMPNRTPYFDDPVFAEPYQSFRTEIRKIVKTINSESPDLLEDFVFNLYSNLHYKQIKKTENSILGIIINYCDEYPKLIYDTIVVRI